MTINEPNNIKGYAPLTIKASTKERLRMLKPDEQSYTSIIEEMIDFINKNKELFNEYKRNKIT